VTTQIVIDKNFQVALKRYHHEGGSSHAVAQAAAQALATADDVLACKRVLTTFAAAMTIDHMPTALRLDMQQTLAVIARLERNRTDS
jgi:pyrimidine deaminase RibD-like protein